MGQTSIVRTGKRLELLNLLILFSFNLYYWEVRNTVYSLFSLDYYLIVITLKYEVDPVPGQDVGALPGVSQEGVKLLLDENLYEEAKPMWMVG